MVTFSSRLVCNNFSVHIIIIIIIISSSSSSSNIIIGTIDNIVSRLLDETVRCSMPDRNKICTSSPQSRPFVGFIQVPIKCVPVFFIQEVKRFSVKVASHLDLRPSVRTGGATCMSLLYVFMARRGATSTPFESLLLFHQNIFPELYSFRRISH
jgi:hypothetical protein